MGYELKSIMDITDDRKKSVITTYIETINKALNNTSLPPLPMNIYSDGKQKSFLLRQETFRKIKNKIHSFVLVSLINFNGKRYGELMIYHSNHVATYGVIHNKVYQSIRLTLDSFQLAGFAFGVSHLLDRDPVIDIPNYGAQLMKGHWAITDEIHKRISSKIYPTSYSEYKSYNTITTYNELYSFYVNKIIQTYSPKSAYDRLIKLNIAFAGYYLNEVLNCRESYEEMVEEFEKQIELIDDYYSSIFGDGDMKLVY